MPIISPLCFVPFLLERNGGLRWQRNLEHRAYRSSAIFWRATKSTILRNNSLPRTTEAYHSFIVRRTILIDRIRRETGLNVIHCDADVVSSRIFLFL